MPTVRALGRRRVLVQGPAMAAMLGSALLGGCGFRPVYGPISSGEAGPVWGGLAAITVPVLPDRNGQLLRQALQERFERSGITTARRYDLVVAYGMSADPIGYQQDNSVTRIRLVGSATWSLLAQDAQRRTLASGTARNVDGYNVLDQQYFAADMTSETVMRRIAEAVADQMALQLATFFTKRAVSATG